MEEVIAGNRKAASSLRPGQPRSGGLKTFTPPKWVKPIVLVLGVTPLAWAVFGVLSDLFLGSRYFGANPIKEVEHFTGQWALRFLLVTLTVTPLRQQLGWNWLSRYRRMFGVTAFAYATVHLLVYFVLDIEVSWSLLVEDVMDRPYVTIGMLAFLLMLPLAITSTAGMVKRLGGKRWAKLHRLIYVIVVLGTIHFWMSVKKDITEPLLFAVMFAALLGYRVWMWRRKRA
jgi:methionine sulfoxide reductase heme-binding subunit